MKGRWPALYKPKEASKPDRALDPNHTHFILVDDGTQDKLEVEIALRAKLEQRVSKLQTFGGQSMPLSFFTIQLLFDTVKFLGALWSLCYKHNQLNRLTGCRLDLE